MGRSLAVKAQEAGALEAVSYTHLDVYKRQVQRCARRFQCVAVLKGTGTLVAAPDGRLVRNTTGNPGLARGGSGDVLAGMLAALLAQGLPAFEAAYCAVWLHGAAADACAARTSQMTMLPHDILADLGRILGNAGR